MEFILWIVVGALAGWLASIIVGTNRGQGAIMNIIIGIVGAMVGGFVMNLFGASGATGFNIYSIFVATIGAVVLLYLYRLVAR